MLFIGLFLFNMLVLMFFYRTSYSRQQLNFQLIFYNVFMIIMFGLNVLSILTVVISFFLSHSLVYPGEEGYDPTSDLDHNTNSEDNSKEL